MQPFERPPFPGPWRLYLCPPHDSGLLWGPLLPSQQFEIVRKIGGSEDRIHEEFGKSANPLRENQRIPNILGNVRRTKFVLIHLKDAIVRQIHGVRGVSWGGHMAAFARRPFVFFRSLVDLDSSVSPGRFKEVNVGRRSELARGSNNALERVSGKSE